MEFTPQQFLLNRIIKIAAPFSGSNIFNSSNKISYKNKCNATDTQFKFYKKKFKNLKKRKLKVYIRKKYLDQIIKGKQKYYYLKIRLF